MADTLLKIGEIPAYLNAQHGFKISRISIYNWIKVGVNGQRLETTTTPNTFKHLSPVLAVRVAALESFLQSTGAATR